MFLLDGELQQTQAQWVGFDILNKVDKGNENKSVALKLQPCL